MQRNSRYVPGDPEATYGDCRAAIYTGCVLCSWGQKLQYLPARKPSSQYNGGRVFPCIRAVVVLYIRIAKASCSGTHYPTLIGHILSFFHTAFCICSFHLLYFHVTHVSDEPFPFFPSLNYDAVAAADDEGSGGGGGGGDADIYKGSQNSTRH